MALYKTVDTIPLSYLRIRSGALVAGLTVTVKVVNCVTGATLLTSTTMTEITPGVYVYNWTHGLSVFTECVALYTVGALVYAENFQVDESLDKEESLAARAQ